MQTTPSTLKWMFYWIKIFYNKRFTFLIAIIGTSSSYLFKEYYNAEISFYPAKKEIDQNLGRLQSIASNFGVNTVESESNFNISDVVDQD